MSRTKNNKKAQQKLDKNHILQFTQKKLYLASSSYCSTGNNSYISIKIYKTYNSSS